MMNAHGAGGGDWIGMLLVWVALIGVVLFAITRLVGAGRDAAAIDRARDGASAARQILDQRLACGEIDPHAYTAIAERLPQRDGR